MDIGGYPGSEPAATLALQHDRCSMRTALIFVAEEAPRAIPVRVLSVIGLDISRDYEVVGTFARERSSGGCHHRPWTR